MAFAYSNHGQSWRAIEPDWALSDGEVLFLAKPTEEELVAAFPVYKSACLREPAQAAYGASTDAVLQRFEAGSPVPVDLAAYRDALRAIINGTDTISTELPSPPACLQS